MANVANRQTAASRKTSEAGFSIGVSCPGCGGDLELQENFFVLNCDHCGSVLRIILPDRPTAFLVQSRLKLNEIKFHIDRYLKEQNLPLTRANLQVKNIYYPYWRVDAILLKVRNRMERRPIFSGSESENCDFVEREASETTVTSYAATAATGPPVTGIPISIGMRAEFIKMYPFTEEARQDGFDVIPIRRSSDDVLKTTVHRFASYGEQTIDAVGINRTEILEPRFSLIYFPFHIVEAYDGGYRRYLLDGVTGRVLHQAEPDPPEISETATTGEVNQSRSSGTDEMASGPINISEFGSLQVDLHRCSNCGEDLPSRQSYAYLCRNCHRLQLLEPFKLPVTAVNQSAVEASSRDDCFPFWSFRVRTGDGETRSAFAGILASDRVVVPGFRIANFEAFYRLSQKMSSAAPRLELSELFEFHKRHRPVEIGPRRAVAMARAMLYRQILGRNHQSDMADVLFEPIEATLIYVPFHPESYFFVDSVLGAITFEKVYGTT